MPAGLQVWNAAGTLIVDTSTQTNRILGQQATGTSDGSITVADFAQGTPWVLVLFPAAWTGTHFPTISISGTTLSWTFNGNTSQLPVTIIYGVRS